MFKKIAITISAVAFVMLAVTVRATAANDDAKLNQPLAQQSCQAFENWFLDRACRQAHVKRVARTKRHLAHNVSR